eukprot:TRINITY_DN25622_c0_g1_i1.p1 TRINITY_DN25622_c0_g1~~TRINITY_DN25622_c0_g1_i1.p1  ORF type:complete len:768 (+),score=288.10 TRINITY_DN25622_c0_g1_i1:121-2424(+)
MSARSRSAAGRERAAAAAGECARPPFGGGVEGSVNLSKRPTGAVRQRADSRKGTVKISIKPLASTVALPKDFEELMWAKLQAAVKAIHTQSSVSYPLEELYGSVRDLCLNSLGSRLYDRLDQACNAHMRDVIASLNAVKTTGSGFLTSLGATWSRVCLELETIKTVFNILDREIVLQATKRPLWDAGIERFREHFESCPALKAKCLHAVIDAITEERTGAATDRILLKSLTGMLQSLRIYPEFETMLISSTRSFYAEEGKKARGKDEAIRQYNLLVARRITEEQQRADGYLASHTRRPLISTVEVHLLSEVMEDILANGFAHLMSRDLVEDLALLHRHLAYPNVQGLPLMQKALRKYVIDVGSRRVGDMSADGTLIEDLLALKRRLGSIVEDAFRNETGFVTTLRDAFEYVLAIRDEKPALLLAKHVDSKMRIGTKETEDGIEPFLESCLDMLRLIKAKDAFEAFYSRDFAKRLLFNRCASKDTEKAFIGKLKAQCGPSFTQKLEGMLTDLSVSEEVATEFKGQTRSDSTLQVTVLTQSHWPTYPTCEVLLPSPMSAALKGFEDFYLVKHKGRKLEWQSCLCTCTVKAVMPKWKKELVVSLLQALVLLVFNSVNECTFADIKTRVGTQDPELTRAMQHLTFSQHRILKRNTKGSKEIADTDVFRVTEEFQHKNYRVRMNLMMKDTEQETKNTTERVFEDRKHSVDACIVRTMKSRKTLSHPELMSVVLAQINFPVQPADLKKRVEYLIEREYLARDEEKQNLYHYLA